MGAELWGRVVQAADTLSLPGAMVEVVGEARSATANRLGLYRFVGLRPGTHELRVRLLGFRTATLAVEVQEGRAVQRDISLERQTTTLPEVRIEGVLRRVPPRFGDVYHRMTTANGKFFTREDIDRLNPPDIQSLLMLVPMARVTFNGIEFARCNEGGNLALSPGGGKVHIYIDGLRMTGRVQTVAGESEQREVLRLLRPTQLQAIEVYSGVARIPGEFLEDACAVIAIWTRSY